MNQTQAACLSLHQGEIRDTVKVPGINPVVSKLILLYFRERERGKEAHTNETQVGLSLVAAHKNDPHSAYNPLAHAGLLLLFSSVKEGWMQRVSQVLVKTSNLYLPL